MPNVHRLMRIALPLLAIPVFAAKVVPQQGWPHRRCEAAPSDPSIIYIGYAVGGVWKSENNGTTWTPVFDTYATASIGDLAIHPTNPNIVYVGTGEANNRQTSSFGDGIYKTTDGGRNWNQVKFIDDDTEFTDLAIDPSNSSILYAASYQRRRQGCCFNRGAAGADRDGPFGEPDEFRVTGADSGREIQLVWRLNW
jgi:hypothetical protein